MVTRVALIFGLIGSLWLGVTAALGEADDRFVTRREWNRQQDSMSAAAVLREVRDSARYDGLRKRLDYVVCREDFSRQQCLRPDR